MSDTDETKRPAKTLSLKKTETSTVKQSFSHGRTKAVVVEKKRSAAPPVAAKAPAKPADKPAEKAAPAAAPAAAKPAAQATRGVVLRQLSDEEKARRAAALADARVSDSEARRLADQEAERKAREEEQLKAERVAAEKRKVEEDARKAADEAAKKRAEQEAARRQETAKPGEVAPVETARRRLENEEEDDGGGKKGGPGKPGAPKAPAPKKAEGERRRGKLTVTKALSDDDERVRSVASYRRHLQRVNKGHQQQPAGPAGPRDIIVPETITVADLANRMARRTVDVIKVLMKNGMMATPADVIDADTAELVAAEYGHVVKRVAESDVLEGLTGAKDEDANLQPRPPVVTVMGHVDHGKTSLLDAMRKSDVVSGEAGGITQHIGAYQVNLKSGQKITFLDTPGHAAFTQMRARGAKVTDLVILVVAADDGVMPQTVEAIAHAKAAGVPMIVAVNKIDKGDANPTRVKTELLQHEIQVEDLGGETQAVEVSATKGIGLDKLEEAIMLQAEILDLKANPDRAAEGAVIEAKLDKGRGPVATVLVQRGTLKVGDIVVAGAEWGRVRLLANERGETVQSAGPSTPIEVLGLSAPPEAGDEMVVVESEARAREVAEYRGRKRREQRQATSSRQTLDQLLQTREAGEKRLLPLVLKTDVQGSSEAIQGALAKLGTSEVGAQILQSGVGGITESDVILAHASGAAVIGFNVRANNMARDRAKRDGVEIRYYNIIYNLVDDVKAALSGLLTPETREKFLGNAEILEVFNISKVGKVAGCRVTEGSVKRGAKVRLIRDNVVIHEGDLSTLKRFKDEVREVQAGQECGMAFTNYQDMQKGDVIECFDVETIQRALG
ncbi:MAG TPA: translation initiation factor IF-2 [Rhizomicrobium sp.]|nr:translation initiation factor IF-2 [Rhizomicrobium sp.]